MKRSIAPLWTEAALILLIVGVAVVSVVAFDRPGPLSAWEKEKLSLTQRADALERENRSLRDTVRVLEARIAQRADVTGTRAHLLTEIEELHKRRDRAQASAQSAIAEVDKTHKALAALEAQLSEKKTHLETMNTAAAGNEAALAKAQASHRKALERLAEKETDATRRTEAAEAGVVRIKRTLRDLETTLIERRAEQTTLSEEISESRKTLAALDDQVDRKNTLLEATSEAAARKKTEMVKTRDSLRKALENLTQQETAAAKRTDAARAELVRVNQALAALETTLGERRAELARLSQQVARQGDVSQQTIRTLTSELEALKIQRDLAKRQVDAGKSQAERLRQEVDALETKRRAQQAKLKSVEDAVRRRKAALDRLSDPPAAQTPAQLTDRNVCLEAWARVTAEPKARARLAKLREKIAAAETELCELNKRHKTAKEKLKPPAGEPERPRP